MQYNKHISFEKWKLYFLLLLLLLQFPLLSRGTVMNKCNEIRLRVVSDGNTTIQSPLCLTHLSTVMKVIFKHL